MDASLLRDEITIRVAVITRDDQGGTIETWQDFATVYARAKAVRAADRYRSGRIMAIESYEFVVRWIDNLDPKMRIIFRGKEFLITGIEPYDDRAWIKILGEGRETGSVGSM